MSRLIMFGFATLLSDTAFAHPGSHHDAWYATILHILSEPDHLALLLAAIIAGWAGARLMLRRNATVERNRHHDPR